MLNQLIQIQRPGHSRPHPRPLAGANLAGANLTRAHLTDANLTRAHLTDAYLIGADLAGANLTGLIRDVGRDRHAGHRS